MNRLLFDAIVFAAEKHKLQKRKGDGSSYICHSLRVTNTLVLHGVTDPTVLAAAVLHDTVEDTQTTLDEIEAEFGARVRSIVAEVTDDKSLPQATRKLLQLEHAKHASPEAQMIKMADKYDNFQDLTKTPPQGWDSVRILGYYTWGYDVVLACKDALPSLFDEITQFMTVTHLEGVPLRVCTLPYVPTEDIV